MIIRNKNNTFALLFAWHGTIFPKVLPTMLVLSSVSCLLGFAAHYQWFNIPTPPVLGFTIFGIILSIFLGFRNNACYDRWWEGRKLWGTLIATQRHLIRDSQILPHHTRENVLYHSMIFTCLLRDRLRYQTAHLDEFLNYSGQISASVKTFSDQINPPQAALTAMQKMLVDSLKQRDISDIVYQQLSAHIHQLGAILSGCERIASTPLPFAYSVLLHRAIYSFCFMLPFGLEATLGLWTPVMVAWLVYMFWGLDALSSQLEEPFGMQDNDLPLDSIVRIVERDILTALGEPLPPPVEAQSGKLL